MSSTDASIKTEFQFGADYSTTSNLKCKKCNETIEKGQLRLSFRSPSPLAANLIVDNWHHYACFWELIKEPLQQESFRGFQCIKEEDKEKIRESIKEHMRLIGVEPDAATSSEDEPAGDVIIFSRAKAQYSKSPRSKCNKCSNSINKGTMRYGWKSKFYHFECFFNEDNHFVGEIEQMQGFNELTVEDQALLVDAYAVIKEQLKHRESGPGPKRKKLEVPASQTAEQIKAEQLTQQNIFLAILREGFLLNFNLEQIKALFEVNSMEMQSNQEEWLDSLCDAALFGRPFRCDKCCLGYFVYSASSQLYACSGHMSAWAKCPQVTKKPPRAPFGMPSMFEYDIPWIRTAPINKLSNVDRIFEGDDGRTANLKKVHKTNRTSMGADLETGEKCEKADLTNIGKVLIKNGTPVDAEFQLAAVCHVVRDSKDDLYSATLSQTDMATECNSYYKIQLLKQDTVPSYWVFRSWGRIGTTLGGTKSIHYKNIKHAIQEFENQFLDKTGNRWQDRQYFRKKPGKMNIVETDTSDLNEMQGSVEPGSKSELPKPVIDLMKMIFDVNQMKATLKEYDIDTEKMPLGKLSKTQITNAYTVLQELNVLLEAKKKDDDQTPAHLTRKNQILDASNRFYTLIPHKTLTLLDSKKIIKTKTAMLDALLEVFETFEIMKSSKRIKANAEKDPVDVNYAKLNTQMTVLSKNSDEFNLLANYAKTTHGQTHNHYKFDVVDIFKIERDGEEKKFKRYLGNRMLLWHGSGVSNYGGILSQGLRIAPPEAPATGYMFGKGVYFADMFSKSANYCRSTINGDGLLLLADVALGKPKEELMAVGHSAASMGRYKTDSCKGVGATLPDPTTHVQHPDGYVIPNGVPISRAPVQGLDFLPSSLIYNEYIVYDTDQIFLRYLVKVKFLHR